MDFASLGLGSFPRQSLVEDTVDYYIHLVPTSTAATSQQDVKSELENLLPDILKAVEPLTTDFIWQRDEFNLEIVEKDGKHTLEIYSLSLSLSMKNMTTCLTSFFFFATPQKSPIFMAG